LLGLNDREGIPMQFFVDSTDDQDHKQRNLARQAFYQDVTWACVSCRSENTVETKDLPEDAPHYGEKVPSGTHYRVFCRDCGEVSHGFPPVRYRMGCNGSVVLQEVSLIQPGQCVIGWGIVDEITRSAKSPDKMTVTVEGGLTWDEDADDHMMIMSKEDHHR
jgi:hypothetical protein